jgi:CxxC motif-containing protein (DUF1111 family)
MQKAEPCSAFCGLITNNFYSTLLLGEVSTKMRALFFVGCSILSLAGCNPVPENNTHPLQTSAPALSKAEAKPGGDTSVSYKPFPSFELPAANIPTQDRPLFHAGKALAHQPWVKPPTITDTRDGLGPLYNARTCLMCHVKGGKGFIPDSNKFPIMGSLVRLSKPGFNKIKGIIPHPIYGDQIQGQSTSLAHQLRHSQKTGSIAHDVAPEAYVYINWSKKTFTYPDQQQVILRRPELDFRNLGYGPLEEDTLFSLRIAPSIHGMGLLELIAQKDLDKLTDPDDLNSDGISGRSNQVWDVELKKTVPGRFGLKANKASLKMQVAGAFANDLGISNSLFPQQPCTEKQITCNQVPNGNDENGFEIADPLLELVTDFNRNLAPVLRRDFNDEIVNQGREYFYQVGCQKCHQPDFKTQPSRHLVHLGNQHIWPYSDLLLHDMGEALADNRPDYIATGSEWRTAPLWGVGLQESVNGSKALLHDGRAQTIEEAILWHGGEASIVKAHFTQLKQNERDALIKFVNSL